MKTDNQITAQAAASHETIDHEVINPVFTECLGLLSDVYTKIKHIYDSDPELRREIQDNYPSFEDGIISVVLEIGGMAKSDYTNRHFFDRVDY